MEDRRTLTRRGLLGATAGLAATAALARGAGLALATTQAAEVTAGTPLLPPDRIGLQLYSVRDEISAVGFARVFKQLAKIGFKVVEFAGYTQGTTPEITPAQLRNLLSTYGLRAVGSHVSPSNDDSMKQILDDAQTIGIP